MDPVTRSEVLVPCDARTKSWFCVALSEVAWQPKIGGIIVYRCSRHYPTPMKKWRAIKKAGAANATLYGKPYLWEDCSR